MNSAKTVNDMKTVKAKIKGTSAILEGCICDNSFFVSVDHDTFERYDLDEIELCEPNPNSLTLKEAAEEYRRETCNKACKNDFLDNHPSPSIKTAFIAGAEWQKDHVSDYNELEDEVKNYFQGLWPDTTTAEGCNATMSFTAPAILRLIKHFTYWQYQKDRAEFAKLKAKEWSDGYNEGIVRGKEQMMEDAEECELYWDGYFLAIDLNMTALGYSERDKVKVIIVKEDGE